MSQEQGKRDGGGIGREVGPRTTTFYRSVDELDFLQVTVTLTRLPSSSVAGDLSIAKPESIHARVPWQFKLIGPGQLKQWQASPAPSRLQARYLAAMAKLANRRASTSHGTAEPIALAKVKHGMSLFTRTHEEGPSNQGTMSVDSPSTEREGRAREPLLPTPWSTLNRGAHLLRQPSKHATGRQDTLDMPYTEMGLVAAISSPNPVHAATGGMCEVEVGVIRAYGRAAGDGRDGQSGLFSTSPALDVPMTFVLDGTTYQVLLSSGPTTSGSMQLLEREETEQQERDAYYALLAGRVEQARAEALHSLGPAAQISSFAHLPEAFALSLVVNAEIKAAHSFPHARVYVQYSIHFPEGWYLEEGAPDQGEGGFTQASAATLDVERGLMCNHFAFPLEFRAFSRTAEVERYPTLYFQVFGLESWNRHVPCGYGYYAVPPTPGSRAHISLPTWRPLGSVYSDMHAFFLGGGPECKDVEWVGASSSSALFLGVGKGGDKWSATQPTPMAVLNRAGVATQSSGTLEIACHTLQQRTWTMRRAREAYRGAYGSRSQLSALERAKERVQEMRKKGV